MLYVYLAGPIGGLSYRACTTWRNYIKNALNSDMIKCLDPMRNNEYLDDGNLIGHMPYEQMESQDRSVMTDDYNDVHRSDVIFANLLNPPKASVGTAMELAWAYHARIPTVVVMEKTGNPYEHPMIREAINYRVETINHGIEMVKHILNISYKPTFD